MSHRRIRYFRPRTTDPDRSFWIRQLADPLSWEWWFDEVLQTFEDDLLPSELQYHGWLIP